MPQAVSGRSWRSLAWPLGAVGALACIAAAGAAIAFAAPASFLIVYVVGILMGLLGGLVASREPGNSVGWLMCGTSIAAGLLHLPAAYGYAALVVEHGVWPLGSEVVWFGAWAYVPVLVFMPLISIRFPDGRAQGRWRVAEWLAFAGAALFALGIALSPPPMLVGFLSIPGARANELAPLVRNPLGVSLPAGTLSLVRATGLMVLLLAYVASAGALVSRFRRAVGDERLQLKWFAYAGSLIAAAFVYGGLTWNFLGQPLYLALAPLEFAALALPIAIGIAILRYRLYDIDLLINRTLVYVSLTAILGALYAAVVTFLNRLFISVSGQKSDAAYVLTAFVIAVAFGPVKDWLQRQVDGRIGHINPSQMLDQFRSSVDAVVAVIDVERVLRELVDQTLAAFNPRWAALYLDSSGEPAYRRGDIIGGVGLEVSLHHDGRHLGRLVVGTRRGGATYADRDRVALQRSADSVGAAIALAEHLGHLRVPTAR